MRCFFALLLLALLGCLPALAQPVPPPAAPDPVAGLAPAAGPDTAAAIHHLFEHKRQSRSRASAGFLGVGLLCGYAATKSSSLEHAIVWVGVGLAMLPFSALEGSLMYAYNGRRERRMVAAWQAHRLPPRLKRKLTSQYFQSAP